MSPNADKWFHRRLAVLLALLLAALAWLLYAQISALSGGPGPVKGTPYAGSASCRECHEVEYRMWEVSHHARAQRPVDGEKDATAFTPDREFTHGSYRSNARVRDGAFEVVTTGSDGKPTAYQPEWVIGEKPLRQMIIPWGRGRCQVTEVAYDPAKNEWFNVYGEEDRKPHEWGHWTNRGMTWNSMCAGCHMTDLRKNYDSVEDSFGTTWSEMGVGCEGCHGPYSGHIAWHRSHGEAPWPARRELTSDQVLDMCGACHARREELTEQFVLGDKFLDHYRPILIDDGEYYYPDGQVRDEDFEYGSFLMSKMYTKGVRCLDCHEAHTAKIRRPGNWLCLHCHKPKIDLASHGHHQPDTPGGNCVDCHMPLTPYMQRHFRRDHGFTIPDPLLTQELAIPNACNRCHDDKSVGWAIEAVEKWYGKRMDRVTRDRARVFAKARAGREGVQESLVELTYAHPAPAGRAVAAGLLGRYLGDERVQRQLYELLWDREPLVRAKAVRALGDAGLDARNFARLLEDPVRLVRLEAAWALRRELDLSTDPGKELMERLLQVSDQPTGALMRAVFHLDRQEFKKSEYWARKAVEWDGNSAPLRHALALVLQAQRKTAEAIEQLLESHRLLPGEAEFPYSLGLLFNEAGDVREAEKHLSRACDLDPRRPRAWYNLGLARNRLGNVPGAVDALRRAETLEPGNPEYPYARATVHFGEKQFREAYEAAKKALEIAPGYREAAELLRAAQAEMKR